MSQIVDNGGVTRTVTTVIPTTYVVVVLDRRWITHASIWGLILFVVLYRTVVPSLAGGDMQGDDSNGSGSKVNTGVVVGSVIGGVVFLAIVVASAVYFVRRKRRSGILLQRNGGGRRSRQMDDDDEDDDFYQDPYHHNTRFQPGGFPGTGEDMGFSYKETNSSRSSWWSSLLRRSV